MTKTIYIIVLISLLIAFNAYAEQENVQPVSDNNTAIQEVAAEPVNIPDPGQEDVQSESDDTTA